MHNNPVKNAVKRFALCIFYNSFMRKLVPVKKSDLYVITKAKELTKYVIMATEKSPKKYRFTLVVRLQNYCLDITENLLIANMLPLEDENRQKFQIKAGRLLKLLGYFAMICMETECILPKQFENICKLQAECIMFLGKWIASDKKRNKVSSGDMPQKDT